jgi:hypothetical protein
VNKIVFEAFFVRFSSKLLHSPSKPTIEEIMYILSASEILNVSGGAQAAPPPPPPPITCTISATPSCTGTANQLMEAAFDAFNSVQDAGRAIGSKLYDLLH